MIKLINWGNTLGPCKLSCAGVGVLFKVCSAGTSVVKQPVQIPLPVLGRGS